MDQNKLHNTLIPKPTSLSDTVNSQYLRDWYLKVTFYIREYSLDSFPIFPYISTHGIPNYRYLKVNFLGPEKLLWNISSLGWTFAFELSRVESTCMSAFTVALIVIKFLKTGEDTQKLAL